MAEVLVVVEQSGGAVKKVTLEMLTLARTLGEPAAVVFGAPGSAAALTGRLGEYGAARIYAVESDELTGYLVAPKATSPWQKRHTRKVSLSIKSSRAAVTSPPWFAISAALRSREAIGHGRGPNSHRAWR